MEVQRHFDSGFTDDPYLSSFYLAGQVSRERQRKGRYLEGPPEEHHPARMLPEVARSILLECSRPGQRLLVPTTGEGTEQVEASWLGIHSVGIELEPHHARKCKANLALNWALGAQGEATVVEGDARRLTQLVQGPFDGTIWSPPYVLMMQQHAAARDRAARAARMAAAGLSVAPVHMGGPRAQHTCGTYRSVQPEANLGYMALDHWKVAVLTIMRELLQVVTPGGWQAVNVKDIRISGKPVVLFPVVIGLAEEVGWTYTYRRTALLYRVDETGTIRERAGQFQRLEARQAGHPIPVTEDIVFFRRP